MAWAIHTLHGCKAYYIAVFYITIIQHFMVFHLKYCHNEEVTFEMDHRDPLLKYNINRSQHSNWVVHVNVAILGTVNNTLISISFWPLVVLYLVNLSVLF